MTSYYHFKACYEAVVSAAMQHLAFASHSPQLTSLYPHSCCPGFAPPNKGLALVPAQALLTKEHGSSHRCMMDSEETL